MTRNALILRLMVVLSTLLYIAVFNFTYIKMIAPAYDYWGLTHNPTPWSYLAISWVVCIIPSFWMRLKIIRPSQILFLIQYYVIYIPACFILYNTSKPCLLPDDALNLVLLMFAGLSIIQLVYHLPLVSSRHVEINSSLFWTVLISTMALLISYVVISFGGNFRLANLEEIYSVRSALAEAVEGRGTRFGFYAQMWLAGFFFPFCAAVGFEARRRWLLVLVAVGYLLLFGIGGSKTTLFSFVYFPAIVLWLKYTKRYSIPIFTLGLSSLLSLGILIDAVGFTNIAYWYVAVVNFRTFSIPAQLIAQFYDFFQNNPLTYMSHVSGVNLLIQYPYDMDISRLIGLNYYGAPVGSNAGFWAADGLTGFGPPGIIIMSLVCAILFWIFDSISGRCKPNFVIISLIFIATSFGNISLFTIVVSGGLGLLLITLFFMPKKGSLRTAFRV